MKFIFSLILFVSSLYLWAQTADTTAVYYKVKQGETLTSIAKKFHVSTNQVKEWNKLNTQALHTNQSIIVGYRKKPVQAIVTDDNQRKNPDKPKNNSTTGNTNPTNEVIEEGLCSAAMANSIDETKYYARCNNVPVGTIVKVIDLKTNKNVYVKVIGTITSNYPDNILIVISSLSMKKLGSTEENFSCKISYAKN
jgi:spore germination protein YaaH